LFLRLRFISDMAGLFFRRRKTGGRTSLLRHYSGRGSLLLHAAFSAFGIASLSPHTTSLSHRILRCYRAWRAVYSRWWYNLRWLVVAFTHAAGTSRTAFAMLASRTSAARAWRHSIRMPAPTAFARRPLVGSPSSATSRHAAAMLCFMRCCLTRATITH